MDVAIFHSLRSLLASRILDEICEEVEAVLREWKKEKAEAKRKKKEAKLREMKEEDEEEDSESEEEAEAEDQAVFLQPVVIHKKGESDLKTETKIGRIRARALARIQSVIYTGENCLAGRPEILCKAHKVCGLLRSEHWEEVRVTLDGVNPFVPKEQEWALDPSAPCPCYSCTGLRAQGQEAKGAEAKAAAKKRKQKNRDNREPSRPRLPAPAPAAAAAAPAAAAPAPTPALAGASAPTRSELLTGIRAQQGVKAGLVQPDDSPALTKGKKRPRTDNEHPGRAVSSSPKPSAQPARRIVIEQNLLFPPAIGVYVAYHNTVEENKGCDRCWQLGFVQATRTDSSSQSVQIALHGTRAQDKLTGTYSKVRYDFQGKRPGWEFNVQAADSVWISWDRVFACPLVLSKNSKLDQFSSFLIREHLLSCDACKQFSVSKRVQ